MKILIIEDVRDYVDNIRQALDGLGEIRVCTKPCLVDVNFDFSRMEMPLIETVLKEIEWAEVILLDNKLNAPYKGSDLFPHCKGKKVVGISTEVEFGETNFTAKGQLDLKHVQKRLRKIVESFLG